MLDYWSQYCLSTIIYQNTLQRSWGSDWRQRMMTFPPSLFLVRNSWHLQRGIYLLNRAHEKLEHSREDKLWETSQDLNWEARKNMSKEGIKRNEAWLGAQWVTHKGLSTKILRAILSFALRLPCGEHEGCLLRWNHSTDKPFFPGGPHHLTFPFQIKVTYNYVTSGFRMKIIDHLQTHTKD